MPTTELIPIGTTEVESAEITLADGEACTLSVKRDDGESLSIGGGRAEIRKKTSDGDYAPSGFGISGETPSIILQAPGVWIVKRGACLEAFGVDIDGGTVAV